MNREDLILAFAAFFGVVFALGWLAHWIWTRMARAASPRSDRADELAAELLLVEEERDRLIAGAEARAAAAEASAAERIATLEARLRAAEADLEAAMTGLREARRENGAGANGGR